MKFSDMVQKQRASFIQKRDNNFDELNSLVRELANMPKNHKNRLNTYLKSNPAYSVEDFVDRFSEYMSKVYPDIFYRP